MPTPIVTSQKAEFSGTSSSVSISTEATFGVPSVASPVFLDLTTHTLAETNSLQFPPLLRKSVGQVNPNPGTVSVRGDISHLVSVDSIGPILVAAFGSDTVVPSGGGFSHTFKMVNPINSFSIASSDGYGVSTYTGSKCEKLAISATAPSGFLDIKSSWMAQTVTYSASATLTPAYSTMDVFGWNHIGSIFGGLGSSVFNNLAFDCTKFAIDLTNNLHDRKGSTGGRFSIGFGEQVRKVTGNFDIECDASSLNAYNTALWGQVSGPSPNQIARFPLSFTFSMPGSGFNPSITFIVPAITVISANTTRSKNAVITQSIVWEASESAPMLGDDLSVVMINSNSVQYS